MHWCQHRTKGVRECPSLVFDIWEMWALSPPTDPACELQPVMCVIVFVCTEIFCKTKFVRTGFAFKWRGKLPTLKNIYTSVNKALVWAVPSVLSDRLHLTWFVLYSVVFFDSYFLFPAFYCQLLLLPVFVKWISALFYLIVLLLFLQAALSLVFGPFL